MTLKTLKKTWKSVSKITGNPVYDSMMYRFSAFYDPLGTSLFLIGFRLPHYFVKKRSLSSLAFCPMCGSSNNTNILQVVLPQLLEQSNSKQWFKNSLRVWAIGVARLLGIRSYLLGDVPNQGDECSAGKLINIG